MNRKEVRDYITAYLKYKGYGQGYCYYNILINDREIFDIAQAKKEAEEGDVITLDIAPIRGAYFSEVEKQFVVGGHDWILEDYYDQQERRKKYRRNRGPRDFQANKIYAFERGFVKIRSNIKPLVPQKEAQELVHEVMGYYGITDRLPTVVISNRLKVSCYWWPARREIRLARGWGRQDWVLLHEIAHGILDLLGYGDKIAAHGPEFASLVCEVWVLFLDTELTMEDMYEGMDMYGIQYIRDFNVLDNV